MIEAAALRSTLLVGAVSVGAMMAGSALGANCTVGSVTPSFDFTTYNVIFDSFTATAGDNANCDLQVPIEPLGDGVIALYTAEYRGFLDPEATATLTVEHNGVVDQATVTTGQDFFNDVYLQHYIANNGDFIDSQITLALTDFVDPGTQATIDTIDYLEVARTTQASVNGSITQVAVTRTSLVTKLGTTADLLTGMLQPLDSPDYVTALGALGSYTLGFAGHLNMAEGFSISGGGAMLGHSLVDGDVNGLLFSGSLRYLSQEGEVMRPYAELGAHAAPSLGLNFSRSYATGSPTGATIASNTTGSQFGGYAEAGLLFAPAPEHEVAVSASIGQDWLNVAGYSEAFSLSNPFPASFADSTGRYTQAKLGLSWTAAVTPELDLTLTGSVGRNIAHDDVLANVAFVGPVSATGQSEFFVQYGARVGWAINEATSLDAFVLGNSGQLSGTHAQVGSAVRFRF